MDNAFPRSGIDNALRFAKGDVLLVGCGSSYSFLDSTMDPGTDSGYFTMFRFLWQEIFYNAVGLCKSRLFVKIKEMLE